MKYVFPAVFTPEKKGYSIVFPDLEGCYTCGDNLVDSMYMAEDVLAFALFDYEQEGTPIPKPSGLSEIKIKTNEFVNYIVCDTIEYKKRHNNRAIKKTLSIPEWLNEVAVAKGVNFSQVLQESLIAKLGL